MALRDDILGFIEQHRIVSECAGRYRYSAACSLPTVYSSCYAVMTRGLLSDLDCITADERKDWIAYLQYFQQDDGLFWDPVIYNQGWFAGDPFDCGRPHLTCHVITDLEYLGAKADKPFALTDMYSDIDRLRFWLENRDWEVRVGWTGNEIMNMGTLLQYSRDFHSDDRAATAVEFLLDWLETNHINPDTGLWGDVEITDPIWRSHAVQAAYHWWPLFSYDNREFPYIERAIDSVLDTQNPNGGFGWGVHNPDVLFNSSACEDIDSIDPLARMYFQTDYRRAYIYDSLNTTERWVFKNQMPDGGFVFMLDRPFEYGHPELFGPAGVGAMFPTWFRTLSLAIIDKVLSAGEQVSDTWLFSKCPGYQYWPQENV